MAQLFLLPQAVWGHFYCQEPTQRDNQELVTAEFPAHNWPTLFRTEGPGLSLAILGFLRQFRKQYNRMVRYV